MAIDTKCLGHCLPHRVVGSWIWKKNSSSCTIIGSGRVENDLDPLSVGPMIAIGGIGARRHRCIRPVSTTPQAVCGSNPACPKNTTCKKQRVDFPSDILHLVYVIAIAFRLHFITRTNRSDAELMQYLSPPRSCGPSENTWPRWLVAVARSDFCPDHAMRIIA